MTGRSLILSESATEVLRVAKAGGDEDGLNETALAKCRTHGWIQGGDDEPLALTSEGRKLCEKLKL